MIRPTPAGPQPPAEHTEARLALGALVLGALEPAERAAVEAHVATCSACTAELASFAVLPGLLGRLSLEQAASVDAGHPGPPEELWERILASAGARPLRARKRRVATWTAAAVAVAAGVVWFVVAEPLEGAERDANAVVVFDGRDAASDVWGQVTLSPSRDGTQVALAVVGVPAGESCRLVAGTKDGRWEVASTWQANYQGEATVTGRTSLRLADIETLVIRTPDGRTLLDLTVPST